MIAIKAERFLVGVLAFLRISKKIKEETHAREQAANKPVMQAVSNTNFHREEIKKSTILVWKTR